MYGKRGPRVGLEPLQRVALAGTAGRARSPATPTVCSETVTLRQSALETSRRDENANGAKRRESRGERECMTVRDSESEFRNRCGGSPSAESREREAGHTRTRLRNFIRVNIINKYGPCEAHAHVHMYTYAHAIYHADSRLPSMQTLSFVPPGPQAQARWRARRSRPLRVRGSPGRHTP